MERSDFSPTSKNLPTPFAFSRSGLTYDGEVITNYLPVVVAVKNYVNVDRPDPHVTLTAILDNGTKLPEICTPLRDLKNLNFQTELDTQCWNRTDKSRYLIQRLIEYLVAQQQAVKVYRADTLGFLHYEDRVAYNAGSKVIGDLGVEVELLTPGYHFCPPDNVSDEQLADHIQSIIKLKSQVTAPIFAYFILGFLRDLFRKAGVPIKFCMFLYGKQQSMKTTLASHLCGLYDRHLDVEQHLHNLTATEAKLHKILNIEKDMVCIIDDLNKDDSKKKEREQTDKISGLIRAAANDVGRETIQGKDSINGQPLFCAEYLLQNPSTNSRLLILELEPGMIDKRNLLKIQKNANLLTAFSEQFIAWILKNYQKLCQLIENEYRSFINQRADRIHYQERLNQSGAVMAISYEVFLSFCDEKRWNVGISPEAFNAIIANILDHQVECLNLQGKDEPDYIVEVFKHLKKMESYGLIVDKNPKKGFLKGAIYHDADSGCIFIRSDALDEMSQDISENLKTTVSIHTLLKALDANGLVFKDKNKAGTRTKKIGAERCAVLDYNGLVSYVLEVAEDFEDEYGD